jgi:hypothetical protein
MEDAHEEIQDGNVQQLLQEEDESTWEVWSSADEFQSSSESGSEYESGDEELRHWRRRLSVVP